MVCTLQNSCQGDVITHYPSLEATNPGSVIYSVVFSEMEVTEWWRREYIIDQHKTRLVPLFALWWQSRRPSTEQSGGLSCSTVVYGACHGDVREHVAQSEAVPRDSPGRESDVGVGSEVAGCEYNNLKLRFLEGRKRMVKFLCVCVCEWHGQYSTSTYWFFDHKMKRKSKASDLIRGLKSSLFFKVDKKYCITMYM